MNRLHASPPESRLDFLPVRGLRYAVRHWGPEDAPTVFFLHGWMDSSPTFRYLVDALQQHVRGQLAPYEYPKEIEFVDALPMTTTGKVQRRVLRLQEEARARGDTN